MPEYDIVVDATVRGIPKPRVIKGPRKTDPAISADPEFTEHMKTIECDPSNFDVGDLIGSNWQMDASTTKILHMQVVKSCIVRVAIRELYAQDPAEAIERAREILNHGGSKLREFEIISVVKKSE